MSSELPPEDVRKQLQAILASPTFANSPRMSRFLSYVVEETLAGRASELKEYKIGVDVFGRLDSFDPKIDPVVRVDARQLRFKLAAYYEASPDPLVISVPKGAYAAAFDDLRKVPAPAVAPPVEIAVKRTPLIQWLVAIPLTLAGILAAVWLLSRAGGPVSEATPSIAVLPFANLSGDPADEYFTDGLTDEITDALSHTKPLRVIARSSSFQFKGKNVDVRQTGQQLNVSSILTGSVARGGGRIKVLAQLARVSDGSVEWSHRYEQPESDLFNLQMALASDIAGSLRVKLMPASTGESTRDPQAQDFFMRARYEADQLTRDSLLQAIADYSRAIERDPKYAAAHYGLAVARHRLPAYANDPRLFDRNAIESEYLKAIELDPNFPEPHTGLALIAAQVDWDWVRARQELDKASAIAPTAMAEGHYALIAVIQGHRAEALDRIRRARDLDPLGVAILMNTGEIQIMAGEYQRARGMLERFSLQHPEVSNSHLWTALSFLYEGNAEEALTRFQALEAKMPDIGIYEAAAHAAAGRRDEALRLIHLYEGRPDRSETNLAQAYAYLQDEANTLDWIAKGVARHDTPAAYLAVHPAFAFLRQNPKFLALEQRAGVIPN